MAKIEPRIVFTETELKAMRETPGVLRALADDFHDVEATMADGMDFTECSQSHTERGKELKAEADRIEREWENG